MGIEIADTFSLLHFASGIIFYYWGMTLPLWILVNVVYEILENTVMLKIIQKIPNWPGGKNFSDSIVNSTADIVFSTLGWVFASMVDTYLESKKQNIEFNILFKQVLSHGKKDDAYSKLTDILNKL